MHRIVVVGAGPAGIRAAETLWRNGLRPILLEEGRGSGGQGYRQPSEGLDLDIAKLMGSEARKYRRLHEDFAQMVPSIDYRPETLVWGAGKGTLHTLRDGVAELIDYDAVIVATGAMDRIMPLPGWTLPGVFTLGGAQVAMKDQGCLIGKRVVFCGSSPLLPLAALQYKMLGAEVVAICDTTSMRDKISAGPKLLASPKTFVRGLTYLRQLRAEGIETLFGADPVRIVGEESVEALVVSDRQGRERRFSCDAVALGYGLKPETQLAELLGATFAFDPSFRLWLPKADEDGRAAPGLYLAGDGARIGGADAAEDSGRLAAHALLDDLGITSDRGENRRLRGRVKRLRRFQNGLSKAFSWPVRFAGRLGDDVTICRCENVKAGEIRSAMDTDLGPVEINRVKAITRCGMGRCQGRVCGPALQELIAAHAGLPIVEVGRLRGQAPVKPIPVSAARRQS
ncbi:FAD-dependent oxidoreductase [Inquilinus sp. CAU 1745]|uniref:FAD/NAD(P)-dependent oxidoreductase n=1 Tax=Inquilinus sp. CAU 1745 TaxID=3140369 RepID=UPI00325B6F64